MMHFRPSAIPKHCTLQLYLTKKRTGRFIISSNITDRTNSTSSSDGADVVVVMVVA